MARRFFQPVTRRSRVVVAARYRCCAQPAASQHPGDGLKPSLEIAPPGATPIHSGCPLGERPYGSEDAQKGVSPQAPGSRAVTRVLQTSNPGWKSVMSRNLRCPSGGTLPPGSLREVPQVASRYLSPPRVHPTLAFDLRTYGLRRFTSPCIRGPPQVL